MDMYQSKCSKRLIITQSRWFTASFLQFFCIFEIFHNKILEEKIQSAILEETVPYLSVLPMERVFTLSHEKVTKEYRSKNARKEVLWGHVGWLIKII